MSEKLNQKQTIDLKELLISEMIQSEALINLLDRKGIISKQELLEEMKRAQALMIKSKNMNRLRINITSCTVDFLIQTTRTILHSVITKKIVEL